MPQTADKIVVEVTALVGSYSQAMIQVANVTVNNMKAAEDAAKQGSGTIEKALESIAGRVPGLIKNLGDGQNALHLFLQEGAQLLPVFGVWGAVLGGVVGSIDALIASTGAFETATERAKGAQDAFNQAMEATKGAFSEQEQEALGYTQALSLVERGYLGLASSVVTAAIEKQKAALEDAKDTALRATSDIAYKLSARIALSAEAGIDDKSAIEKLKIIEEIQAAIRSSDGSTEFFERLDTKLKGLTSTFAGWGDSFQKVIDGTVAAGQAAFAHQKSLETLNRVQEQTNELQSAWGVLLRSLGFSASETAGAISAINGSLDGYISRIHQAFRATPAGTSDTLKRLRDEVALLDGTAEGNKKARTEMQARANAERAYQETSKATGNLLRDVANQFKAMRDYGETYGLTLKKTELDEAGNAGTKPAAGGGPPKAVSAPRQQAGEDDAIARMSRDADLNERLLLVYKRGGDAQAAMRAQVEALNSARQRGLELGTAEHAQYVERYKDEAARKHRSDQLLADYAKADQLVEAAMTSQEKYEKVKVEYEKLHREGALTDAEYSKVLEKLNLENQGYVEGIQAIGQAIQGGIQGATSFSDALTKVGMALAQMLFQAALFGNGPLGKAFGSLTGLTGGLLGLAFGGGGGMGYDGGTGLGPIGPSGIAGHAAMGGQILPGGLYEVGETGREWFAPTVPGQVIPNHVIKAAAGGGGGSSQPITFNISMAGANGDRTIAEIAAAAVKKGLTSVPEINRQHRIRFA
jgi:hypothetical protein